MGEMIIMARRKTQDIDGIKSTPKMVEERVVKTLVLTNTTSSDKAGFKKLVFSDEDDNKYEYCYNTTSNKFHKAVIPFEYLPSLLKDKKFINIAFRISKTKYNPIGGKYIYNITYPKFLGVSEKQVLHKNK